MKLSHTIPLLFVLALSTACGRDTVPAPVAPLSGALSATEFSQTCGWTDQAGVKCRMAIKDLHPTQFAVGMREVQAKETDFAALSEKALVDKIVKKPAPAVIGPDHKFYITDRHHQGRALSDIGFPEMPIVVTDNWSALDMPSFLAKMDANHWLYLRDENDQPRAATELPTEISKLTDDPYRSLGWAVLQKGAISDSNALFFEFVWGHYFRTTAGIVLSAGATDAEFDAAVAKAVLAAHAPAASSLPGYLP